MSSHEHSCQGHHHHAEPNSRAFFIAITLNTIFVLIEFIYGLLAHSTALIADAGHNLSDVLGLFLALGATLLSRKKPGGRFTYGLRSTSILAALSNAMFLLVVCGAIAWEALYRLSQPQTVDSATVILVAAIGILINGVSAWLFVSKSHDDLNVRSAYLHMLSDAAVSAGVVIAAILMMYTGMYWLDPVISLIIVAVIVRSTWGLMQEALNLALNAIPPNIDGIAVEAYLRNCDGVTDIHDLHIWGMSTTENALTVHLVIPEGYPGDAFMDDITHHLQTHFAIGHSTLQVEQGTTDHRCALHPASH